MNLSFTLFAVLCFFSTQADKVKSALKALEKGDIAKSEELAAKALEKPTTQVGGEFVLSLIFTIDTFSRFNIDSAHYYLLSVERKYSGLDEKTTSFLSKEGVSEIDINNHRVFINELAFLKADTDHSLASFQHFIENYPYSSKYDTAVFLRNKEAYRLARKENTWESYKTFMENYPQSTDFSEAEKNYNKLIFEERTISGGLAELESFLKEHPDTPFRSEVEKKIFDELTRFGEVDKIGYFVNNFADQHLRRFGMDLLFHLDSANTDFKMLLEAPSWRTYADSIKKVVSANTDLLIPVFEHNKYGFINPEGKRIIDLQIEELSPEYYCGKISSDLIAADRILNRLGNTVYEGAFDRFEDLGYGIVAITSEGYVGAIHKSGKQILPIQFEAIRSLNENFLVAERAGRLGVYSILGHKVLEHEFDDIYIKGKLLFFEKDDRVSINLIKIFLSDLKKGKSNLSFPYDDFEIIGNNVIAFLGETEALLTANLTEILPLGDQRIDTRHDTWVIKQNDGYKLFDRTAEALGSESYSRVLQNDNWLAIKRMQKWSVYSKSLSDVPIVGLDSAKLLGDDIILVFRGENGMAIFPNKKIVEFSKNEKLYIIGSEKNIDVDYLVIERGAKNVLFRDGERILESVYEIGYISDEVFSAKSRKVYGAMDNKARLIMRIRYDVIGEAEKGISPVLYKGRFGAYNFNDRILIDLKHDEMLKPYSEHLFIAKYQGRYGLQSVYNKNIIDYDFEDILYWTDSIALVKEDLQWSLLDIYNDEEIYEGILDFEFISKKSDEKVIKFRSDDGLGLFSTSKGLIIKPTFNDIINLGTPDQPLYFCEKAIPEAGYYAVVYKNGVGETLRTMAYRSEEYEKIVCDQ